MSTPSSGTTSTTGIGSVPSAPKPGHDLTAPTTSSVLITDQGRTTIADTVVEKVAGMATREIPGVHKLGSGTARAIGALRDRLPGQRASVTQGVSVEVGERQTAVDLDIVIEYGVSLADVTDAVRRNVIASIESMTGLQVTEVNIVVDDIHLPGEDDTADEAQESRVQ